MNKRYQSDALFQTDQGAAPALPQDVVLYHNPTTYPGARVPHAWLNTTIPTRQISTIDITGKGRFTILTGIGGDKWKTAASAVTEALRIPISVISIGFRQDYEDYLFEWARIREIEESGCVLVRPDRVVAWRSMEVVNNCEQKLLHIFNRILSIS